VKCKIKMLLARRRFGPVLTEGEGEGWLRNIYFLYLVELEAVARAAPLLANMNFGPEDAALRTNLQVGSS
jgi:hypothetical protein